MRLLRLIILQGIEQEAGRLLDHILRHENIHHPFDINKRACLVVDELAGELGALLGVNAHDVLEELGVVGSEVDFLRVEDNLVELAGLGEAGDDLVGNVGAEVDGESESHVVEADDISELFGAFEL